jgi:hypothetical protein
MHKERSQAYHRKALECADPALFLLSDDASFITGPDLAVDGDYRAIGPDGLGELTLNEKFHKPNLCIILSCIWRLHARPESKVKK